MALRGGLQRSRAHRGCPEASQWQLGVATLGDMDCGVHGPPVGGTRADMATVLIDVFVFNWFMFDFWFSFLFAFAAGGPLLAWAPARRASLKPRIDGAKRRSIGIGSTAGDSRRRQGGAVVVAVVVVALIVAPHLLHPLGARRGNAS